MSDRNILLKQRSSPAVAAKAAPRPLLIGGFLVLLVLVPFAGAYPAWVMSHVLLLALFAAGYNLLLGYTGLLSFGHAALFAVGAYTSAFVLRDYPSLPLAVLAGGAAAALASVVIGWLSIRHTRIYFSMLTLAFGMMVYSILFKWRSVTGGDDGIVGVPRGVLGIPGAGLELASLGLFYYAVLVVVVVALYVLWRIVSSPLGLALRGLRDSETRVAFAGLSVRRYRLISFTISGCYAGIAGSMTPPLVSSATPEMAHWTTSADPVLASLLGGTHAFSGPLVGAFLLVALKEVIVRFTEYWPLFLGTVVVALVLAFRGGVVSVVSRLVRQPRPAERSRD